MVREFGSLKDAVPDPGASETAVLLGVGVSGTVVGTGAVGTAGAAGVENCVADAGVAGGFEDDALEAGLGWIRKYHQQVSDADF